MMSASLSCELHGHISAGKTTPRCSTRYPVFGSLPFRKLAAKQSMRSRAESTACQAEPDIRPEPASLLEPTPDEAAVAAIPCPPPPDRAAQPGLIFPLGSPGAWDSGALGKPIVRCFLNDNGQRWCLWYSGRSQDDADRDAIASGTGYAGVAVSADGVNWRRSSGQVPGKAGADEVGRMLGPNSEDWWWLDTAHVSLSDVQMLASSVVEGGTGVYWGYYAGGSFEPTYAPPGLPGLESGAEVEGLLTRPGLVLSQDGRNWARIEGSHHSGALFDAGEPGQWDEAFVGAPQVVAVTPKDFRMYYHSWDAQRRRFVIGFATSDNGISWLKQGPIFEGGEGHDALGALNAHVVKDSDLKKYLLFYEAVAADGSRSIGLAVSPDGIRGWQRLDRPLLEGSKAEGAWDAQVGGPSVVPMAGGRYRLYYSGRAGSATGWQGFGLAINPENPAADAPAPFEGMRTDFERLAK